MAAIQPTDASAGSELDDLLVGRSELLEAVLDAIIPADDYPAATRAGGITFLREVLTERPEWVARVFYVLDLVETLDHDFAGREDDVREQLLHQLGDDTDWAWFAELMSGGYYADAANGGNADEASWRMIGWRAAPASGWSVPVPVPTAVPTVVPPNGLLQRYDAIVIGSGAGGGVAACGLAEAGRTVLVIEAGRWPEIAELARDHLRNPRSDWGLAPRSGPVELGNPRVLATAGGDRLLRPSDLAWSNNAFTAGGGTRVYGAQAWRFLPEDFRMASEYGVPDGSALRDWPIGYDDLEPYYARAEWEVGVSGEQAVLDLAGSSRPYPMGPLPAGKQRERLAAAASTLGISTVSVPLLINSTPYLGRHACEQCAQCIGFTCPVDAKNGSQNTMLARAFATGRASIALETRAERLLTDGSGRVVGVAVVGERDGQVWRAEILAEQVVVAAGAIESARLLLNSPSEKERFGIGNNSDQVGRHLQAHLYGGVIGLFDEPIEELIGPGPSIATMDYRHHNDGIVGGGLLANEFVLTPSNMYQFGVQAGLIARFGMRSKEDMRARSLRMTRIMGPIHEVTSADSRIRLDPRVSDRFGIPVAHLSGSLHPEDIRGRAFLADRAEEWIRAAGATSTRAFRDAPAPGPSGGQHQAGTLRMGSDPSSSVVDEFGRIWGHENVRIVDASVHVTNGGVNPALTIFALAMRTIENMTGSWRSPTLV